MIDFNKRDRLGLRGRLIELWMSQRQPEMQRRAYGESVRVEVAEISTVSKTTS